MCLYLSLGIDLQLTGLNLTDFVILLQTAIPHVTSSHCVPTTVERLSGCWRLSGSRSGPRSADHILRELLGAPHLAAHEGRKTAADDRAHRDEGNAALHEPRRLTNSRKGPNYSAPEWLQNMSTETFPRQRDAQIFFCSIGILNAGLLHMKSPLRAQRRTLARSRTSSPRYPGTRERARMPGRGARRGCRRQRRRARGR